MALEYLIIGGLAVLACAVVARLFAKETEEDRRNTRLVELAGGSDPGKFERAVEVVLRRYAEAVAAAYDSISLLRNADFHLENLIEFAWLESAPEFDDRAKLLGELEATFKDLESGREERGRRFTEYVDAIDGAGVCTTGVEVEALGRLPDEILSKLPPLAELTPEIAEWLNPMHRLVDIFWSVDSSKARAAVNDMQFCDQRARAAMPALEMLIEDRSRSPRQMVDMLRGAVPFGRRCASSHLLHRAAIYNDAAKTLGLLIRFRFRLGNDLVSMFCDDPRKAGLAAYSIRRFFCLDSADKLISDVLSRRDRFLDELQVGLRCLRDPKDSAEVLQGLRSLGRLGEQVESDPGREGYWYPSLRGAIPVILSILKECDDDLRVAALWALRKVIPPKAVALETSLRHRGAETCAWERILRINVIPGVMSLIREGSERLRREAIGTLGELWPADSAMVGDLSTWLDDNDSQVRTWAARMLGDVGFEAGNTVPKLEELTINDPSPSVRLAADVALLRILVV